MNGFYTSLFCLLAVLRLLLIPIVELPLDLFFLTLSILKRTKLQRVISRLAVPTHFLAPHIVASLLPARQALESVGADFSRVIERQTVPTPLRTILPIVAQSNTSLTSLHFLDTPHPTNRPPMVIGIAPPTRPTTRLPMAVHLPAHNARKPLRARPPRMIPRPAELAPLQTPVEPVPGASAREAVFASGGGLLLDPLVPVCALLVAAEVRVGLGVAPLAGVHAALPVVVVVAAV